MLSKLYEEGFLNYQALLLKNYKALEMDEIELIVILKILDIYKSTKKIRVTRLVSETKLKKIEIESALDSLMTKKLYSLDLNENENGVYEEKFNLQPLFSKIEDLFKSEEILKVEEGLKGVVTTIEREFNRTITPMEYNVLEDFVKKDGFTIDEINKAIKSAVMQQKVSLSFIERLLIKDRENALGPKAEPIDPEKKKALDKAFNMF